MSSVYRQATPAVMISGPLMSHTVQWTLGMDVLDTMLESIAVAPRMHHRLKMRNCTMALSFWNHSTKMKTAASTLKATRRPIVAGRDQTAASLPSCMAIKKQADAPMITAIPTVASCSSFSPSGTSRGAAAAAGVVKDHREQPGGSGAERQVDKEAPPPRDLLGKHAAEQRPQDAGAAERPAQGGHARRSPPRGRHQGDDGEGAGGDAGAAHAADGAVGDQHRAVPRDACDQVAQFEEDKDGAEEGEFEVKVAEHLAPCRLEGRGGEEEGASVPSDVAEAAEDGRDARDGVGDDRHVDGEEKDAQYERGQDREEPGRGDGPFRRGLPHRRVFFDSRCYLLVWINCYLPYPHRAYAAIE
ncbi:hypothetical protein L209DRAFT_112549 [Thermothelomyces heterothallicus CBS 203.75]